jgi:hypothetical protein
MWRRAAWQPQNLRASRQHSDWQKRGGEKQWRRGNRQQRTYGRRRYRGVGRRGVAERGVKCCGEIKSGERRALDRRRASGQHGPAVAAAAHRAVACELIWRGSCSISSGAARTSQPSAGMRCCWHGVLMARRHRRRHAHLTWKLYPRNVEKNGVSNPASAAMTAYCIMAKAPGGIGVASLNRV